jgi:glucose dehydrogenase
MTRVRQHAGASRATGLILMAIAAAAALAWVSAGSGAAGDVGWGGFGNTPNNNRHSPLKLIDRGNVAQLGRVF